MSEEPSLYKRKKRLFSGSKKSVARAVVIVCILVIATITGILLYRAGYNAADKKVEQNDNTPSSTSQSSETQLPSAGEVSEISNDKISVSILGSRIVTANITKDTVIIKKDTTLTPQDIKKSDKVILFTKKSGNNTIATRIVVQ